MNQIRRIGTRTGLVVAVMGGAMVAFATGAFAQTSTDPTGGAAESTLSAVQSWITSHGAPMVAALLVIGLTFGLLLKFAKRGARAA